MDALAQVAQWHPDHLAKGTTQVSIKDGIRKKESKKVKIAKAKERERADDVLWRCIVQRVRSTPCVSQGEGARYCDKLPQSDLNVGPCPVTVLFPKVNSADQFTLLANTT